MEIVLRPAREEDAASIARVTRSSRLEFLPYAPPAHSEQEYRAWACDWLVPSGGVTVAVHADSVIGVLASSTDADGAWIEQMYVAPGYCGRGVGSKLLRRVLADLPGPVRLYTFQQNLRARRFYERFGFRAIEFGDGSGNEEGCPDVLYVLGDVLADSGPADSAADERPSD